MRGGGRWGAEATLTRRRSRFNVTPVPVGHVRYQSEKRETPRSVGALSVDHAPGTSMVTKKRKDPTRFPRFDLPPLLQSHTCPALDM